MLRQPRTLAVPAGRLRSPQTRHLLQGVFQNRAYVLMVVQHGAEDVTRQMRWDDARVKDTTSRHRSTETLQVGVS
jgi:hypothetical protein